MAPGQRGLGVVAQVLVELGVLLVADVLLAARPQRVGRVHGLPGVLLHVLALLGVPLFLLHQDGQADVVGVFADDELELPVAQVLALVVAQVQDDAGATRSALDVLHLEVARAPADPAHALGRRQAGAMAFHGDLVGHDEARVEAHAELADELGVLLLVATEVAHEVFGATLGNGAQVVNRLLRAHADAVVGDGDGACLGVESHAHVQVGRVFEQGGVVQALEPQLVAGVRCVGNQLAQKDVGVGIQRMGDEVQQLRHFGLERQGLFAHGSSLEKRQGGLPWRERSRGGIMGGCGFFKRRATSSIRTRLPPITASVVFPAPPRPPSLLRSCAKNKPRGRNRICHRTTMWGSHTP
ncbi:hypothetical protein FQZ97_757800 [compost metagenome]